MSVSEDTLRVLVVEDEEPVAAMLADFVRELGAEPVGADTAEAALQALASERVDVIVLDLRLPGMSGLDFLRLPAIRDSEIPVIVMSGVATEPEGQEALRLGALEFLHKPVSLERFANILAFLELHVLKGRGDRRRLPRATVMFPVRVHAGWEWRALDLSRGAREDRTGRRRLHLHQSRARRVSARERVRGPGRAAARGRAGRGVARRGDGAGAAARQDAVGCGGRSAGPRVMVPRT
jgi:DNA-binding response OmpR family regulator